MFSNKWTKRIAVGLPTVFLGAGAVALSSAPAQAISGACLYYPDSGNHAALNAWNGGPFVKVYHACADPNDRFTITFPGGSNVQLKFTGGGNWNGRCLGNANNDPNNETASLDVCSPAGWGTLFTEQTSGCGAGQLAFKNNHSGGYLGPPDTYSDGSPFYLNKPGFFCFSIG